jgi:uncharacterized protein (DUF1501 family)
MKFPELFSLHPAAKKLRQIAQDGRLGVTNGLITTPRQCRA